MTIARKLYQTLSGPKLLHYTMPILMVYLILGTVAQKYIGLYAATQTFFGAPIIWIWQTVPLPGMPVIVALIFINLSCKLMFKSPWRWHRSGIILTHIGVMLLLLGGLFTSLFSSEGYIAFGQGEHTQSVADYHIREFVVLDGENTPILRINHNDLHAGHVLEPENLPFTILIDEYCSNCEITAREYKTENHIGMAQHMQLSPKALEKTDEENMAGLTFKVIQPDQMQIFVSLEEVPQIPEVEDGENTYRFALRRVRREFPFTIELVAFEKESHPGTAMAKAYRSTVLIKDDDLQWESIISMNAPLRYKGYTFFQSSFSQTPQGYVSVLAVVWNAGRIFPYISGIVMCIGLLMHLFIRARPKKKIALLALFTLFSFAPDAYAEERLNIQALGEIPVLHEGRIKPLDSMARGMRKSLSGKETNALPWFVETLFDPARAQATPNLKITNPEILTLLNLPKRKSKLYSFDEVSKGIAPRQEMLRSVLDAPEDQWTPQQRDLVKIYDNIGRMSDIMSSLSALLPISITIPETVPDDLSPFSGQILTYFKLRDVRKSLQSHVKSITSEKGSDFTSYAPEEQGLAQLAYTLAILENTGRIHSLFTIIPHEGEWITPWKATEVKPEAIRPWAELAQAYHEANAGDWDQALHALVTTTRAPMVRENAIKAEYYYNQYNPFYFSFLLSLLAFGALLGASFGKVQTALRSIALSSLSFSLICQIAGLVARSYILQRPPVSTLYETVLFVMCIITLYAVIAFLKDRRVLWLWLGAILGVLLSTLGFAHNQDGDSLIMLGAVLNTNFWLTTHVLCITAGYAFCAITTILAHYALILMARGTQIRISSDLFKNIHSLALLALFFSGIGTVLGGIWADQSWGRFWGWDPKENGALLIVLWLVWVLHGRISGQMGIKGVLYGLSYLSVILALSWFGVNLLSVGLHAYGFTDSAAWILGGFIGAESLFIIACTMLIRRHERNAHA